MSFIRMPGSDAEQFTSALVAYAKLKRTSAGKIVRNLLEENIGGELNALMNSSFFEESVASIEQVDEESTIESESA